ncbi:hypothetical protein MHAS44199_10915 [Mycolicibacterium hassiacum DSM 44199]|nr:hypothetical protein [Mycolicibacterium hassiacum DSM 44199]
MLGSCSPPSTTWAVRGIKEPVVDPVTFSSPSSATTPLVVLTEPEVETPPRLPLVVASPSFAPSPLPSLLSPVVEPLSFLVVLPSPVLESSEVDLSEVDLLPDL